jgi:L-ribulose-5-phosphate 4-epimerase
LKAVEYALALEICAEIALKTLDLNPSISELPLALREKHFLRKHGKDAYYGQT